MMYELEEVFETTFRLFISVFDSLHITASLSQMLACVSKSNSNPLTSQYFLLHQL
jgi:hypothetical protein